MKLYTVHFANGWTSAHIAECESQAIQFALQSYSVWYEDEPYIEFVTWRELQPTIK